MFIRRELISYSAKYLHEGLVDKICVMTLAMKYALVAGLGSLLRYLDVRQCRNNRKPINSGFLLRQ